MSKVALFFAAALTVLTTQAFAEAQVYPVGGFGDAWFQNQPSSIGITNGYIRGRRPTGSGQSAWTRLHSKRHVTSFFAGNGLTDASMTRRTGDQGIDGFASHTEGLIVVQCKRYALENKVGRPAIQQFKGAMSDFEAWRGYFVTTSKFTVEAEDSAAKTPNLFLIDLDGLISWQSEGPDFSAKIQAAA